MQHVQDAGDRQRSRRRRRRSAGAVAPDRGRCASARPRPPTSAIGKTHGQRADPDPDRVVGDAADRPGGLQPGADRADHGERDQPEARCRPGGAPASMSRVAAAPRPIARTTLPSQRAPSSHSRFRPRPMPLIAVTIGDGSCGGGLGVRRGRLCCPRSVLSIPDLAGRRALRRRRPAARRAGPTSRGSRRVWMPDPSVHAARLPGSGVGARGSGGLSSHEPHAIRCCHTNHIRHTGSSRAVRAAAGDRYWASTRCRYQLLRGVAVGPLLGRARDPPPDPAGRDVPVVQHVLAAPSRRTACSPATGARAIGRRTGSRRPAAGRSRRPGSARSRCPRCTSSGTTSSRLRPVVRAAQQVAEPGRRRRPATAAAPAPRRRSAGSSRGPAGCGRSSR